MLFLRAPSVTDFWCPSHGEYGEKIAFILEHSGPKSKVVRRSPTASAPPLLRNITDYVDSQNTWVGTSLTPLMGTAPCNVFLGQDSTEFDFDPGEPKGPEHGVLKFEILEHRDS